MKESHEKKMEKDEDQVQSAEKDVDVDVDVLLLMSARQRGAFLMGKCLWLRRLWPPLTPEHNPFECCDFSQ